MLGVQSDLAGNWAALRSEFTNAGDVALLMRQHPDEVVRFLIEGPGPRTRHAAPPPNTTRPEAGRTLPPVKPFNLAEAQRSEVPALLAARGLSPAQMKELRADLRAFINHGDAERRTELTKKYAHVLSDDLNKSELLAPIIRNLRDV